MNFLKRHELVNNLYNDANFLQLTNNRDRVRYVFEHVMSYEKFYAEVKENRQLARLKSAKNLSLALNYKKEAYRFKNRAENNNQNGDLLDSAMRLCSKVNVAIDSEYNN